MGLAIQLTPQTALEKSIELLRERGIKGTAAEQQQRQMPLKGQDRPLGLHLPRKEIRMKIKGRGE